MNLENNYPIARVKWIDSGAAHGWTSDLAAICTIDSVGFLIEDVPDHVVLCESINKAKGTSPYGCSCAIPRSQIKDMRILSMPRSAGLIPSETKEATGSDITRQFIYGPSYGLHSQ